MGEGGGLETSKADWVNIASFIFVILAVLAMIILVGIGASRGILSIQTKGGGDDTPNPISSSVDSLESATSVELPATSGSTG